MARSHPNSSQARRVVFRRHLRCRQCRLSANPTSDTSCRGRARSGNGERRKQMVTTPCSHTRDIASVRSPHSQACPIERTARASKERQVRRIKMPPNSPPNMGQRGNRHCARALVQCAPQNSPHRQCKKENYKINKIQFPAHDSIMDVTSLYPPPPRPPPPPLPPSLPPRDSGQAICLVD